MKVSGDEGESGNEDNNCSYIIVIPLTTRRIRSKTLQKVTDFMKYYDEEEMIPIFPPFTTENIEDIVQKWYADFISVGVDHSLLLDIISASNFLVSTYTNLIILLRLLIVFVGS